MASLVLYRLDAAVVRLEPIVRTKVDRKMMRVAL